MIGSGRDNSSLDLEFFIPSCVLVNNEDSSTQVKEVDSALLVDVEVFWSHGNIDFAPVNFILSLGVKNDSLVLWNTSSSAARTALKSSGFCDTRWSDSGIRRPHVIWMHGVFVKLGNCGIVNNVLLSDSQLLEVFKQFLSRLSEASS